MTGRRRRRARARGRPRRRRRRRASPGGSAPAPARPCARPPRAPRGRPPRPAGVPGLGHDLGGEPGERRRAPSAGGPDRWPERRRAPGADRAGEVDHARRHRVDGDLHPEPGRAGPVELQRVGRAARAAARGGELGDDPGREQLVDQRRHGAPGQAGAFARPAPGTPAPPPRPCAARGRGCAGGPSAARPGRRSRAGRGQVADLGVPLAHRRGRVGLAQRRPGRLPARAAPPRRPAPTPPGGPRRRRRTRRARARPPAGRAPPARSACTAADRAPPPIRNTRRTGTPACLQRVDGVGEPAQQALHRGAGQVLAVRRAQRQAVQRAGRVGPVRRPLALEVGHEHQAARARPARSAPARRAGRGRRRAAGRWRRAPAPR